MTLAEDLAVHSRFGDLSEPQEDGRVRCLACAHRCSIAEGHDGVCKVRSNHQGTLMVPYGYVNALHCDPIEKKPFFHALPGARAMSFGMLGCDLHCSYCQNWFSSQALRDPRSGLDFQETGPDDIVRAAVAQDAACVVSTYNEPLITAEWAVEIFRHARAAGLATGFVSNGNATLEALSFLRPWLQLLKIDLKCFTDRGYRELGGRLEPVLNTIEAAHHLGFWVEVVTLVVPGFNDTPSELWSMAGFLAGVSPDIPWHVTAFHPDYRMTGPPPTSPETLLAAVAIGRQAGLRYVYAGNLPGRTGDSENTRCPGCGAPVIEREGFRVLRNGLDAHGKCSRCQTRIAGFWSIPNRN